METCPACQEIETSILDVCGWRGAVPTAGAYGFLTDLDRKGYRLVSEGQGVLDGRVVELVQVGWFCNEATSGDKRSQLCGHPYPCGATFAKRVKQDTADAD
jgi:hypothetical protein